MHTLRSLPSSPSRHAVRGVGPRVPLRRLALLPLALITPLLGGCYSYRPLNTAAAAPRSEVRLFFSAEGASTLRDAAGYDMRQLDGTIVRALADSAVVLAPQTIITRDGDELPWRRGELVVPWRTVERSQQRTMDKGRSRGLAAVMAAAFTGVVYFALKSIAGGGGATLQPGAGAPE